MREYGTLHMLMVAMLFTLLLCRAETLHAQIQLKDPGFPKEERITYIKTSERGREIVETEMKLVSGTQEGSADEGAYYSYSLESDSKDVLAKLSPETLTVSYSEVWEKNRESTVHKINKLLRNEKKVEDGQLLLTDANGFDVSLRGFPFEEEKKAEIIFLNDSNKFSLELKVKNRETMELDSGTYDCWKIQVGLDGILGRFFPKSYYWYTAAPPHFLVRSESAGMGGGEESIMEIRSYSARN